MTSEGWTIITRSFFSNRNNFIPDIKEMEIQVGDMILICSDGVYGNGKWSKVNEPIEYFRISKEAIARLMELGYYRQTPDNVRHSCVSCPNDARKGAHPCRIGTNEESEEVHARQ